MLVRLAGTYISTTHVTPHPFPLPPMNLRGTY